MVRMIVSLGICALLAGCAAQPTAATAAAAAPRAATPPTSTTTSMAVVDAPASPGQAPAANTGASAKPTAPPGFQIRVRKGETVYCKTLQATGSMFPREVCLTQPELERLSKAEKRSVDQVLGKPVGCNKSQGCVPGQ